MKFKSAYDSPRHDSIILARHVSREPARLWFLQEFSAIAKIYIALEGELKRGVIEACDAG